MEHYRRKSFLFPGRSEIHLIQDKSVIKTPVEKIIEHYRKDLSLDPFPGSFPDPDLPLKKIFLEKIEHYQKKDPFPSRSEIHPFQKQGARVEHRKIPLCISIPFQVLFFIPLKSFHKVEHYRKNIFFLGRSAQVCYGLQRNWNFVVSAFPSKRNQNCKKFEANLGWVPQPPTGLNRPFTHFLPNPPIHRQHHPFIQESSVLGTWSVW